MHGGSQIAPNALAKVLASRETAKALGLKNGSFKGDWRLEFFNDGRGLGGYVPPVCFNPKAKIFYVNLAQDLNAQNVQSYIDQIGKKPEEFVDCGGARLPGSTRKALPF
jgi:hypothetical protein